MAEEGPTQKELDEAKSYLKGSQMLALDTSSKLAQALLQYQLDKLPIDYIEKRNAIVDAVTLDDAKKAAQAAVGPGPAHRDRRPRPASRRAARRGAAEGELTTFSVMAGHSRPKDGVASLAYPGHPRFHASTLDSRHLARDALRATARA